MAESAFPFGEAAFLPGLVLFPLLAALAPVSAGAADLCAAPVEDTAGTGAVDAGRPHALLHGTYTFPGSPLVLLDPYNRPGIWTLSDDRRFVRIPEDAVPRRDPTASMNARPIDSVLEPHSGRVLGVSAWRGVWKLAPGGGRFAAHRSEQWPEIGGLRARTVAPATSPADRLRTYKQ